MKKPLPILWDLFFTMVRIGMFTFGGGYAMISMISDICVEKKKWLTHDEMMNMTVIAESTPGPIAINCATYVGMKQAGIPGSIVATAAMVLPSFVVIYVIAQFLDNFLAFPLIAKAFRGIQIGVSLIILRVGISMIQKMKKKPLPLAIMTGSLLAMLTINLFALNFSTISLMLIAGSVSLGLFLLKKGGTAK